MLDLIPVERAIKTLEKLIKLIEDNNEDSLLVYPVITYLSGYLHALRDIRDSFYDGEVGIDAKSFGSSIRFVLLRGGR